MTEIKLEFKAGSSGHDPTKFDVQKNIDAVERAIKNNKTSKEDKTLLSDTVSVLRAIQRKLPS